MACEWSTASLDSVVDEVLDRRGVTVRKLRSGFVPAGHRVISAKLIKSGRIDLAADEPRFVDEPTYRKWMQTTLLPDDVILTSEAPLGEVAYIKEPLDWCLGQRLFAIRTNKGRLNGRFLYYALQSDAVRHELHSRATGTTAQGIRQSELRRIRVPVPPVDAQRAIAHILGTLDDKIELNRRMNETLEAIARALFKSWFVDFDPVRANSECRDPGMAPHLAHLFPDSFEDSELGEIPKGWEVRSLGDIAEHMIGGDWGADGPSGANTCAVRCLRGVDLHSLRTTGWSNAPVRYVSEGSLAKRRPEPGDVIVEGSGECGRSLAFTDHVAGVYDEPIVYSNFCKRVRTASQGHAIFVESVLNGLVRSGDMKSFVTGTAMPNLDLRGLMEAVPVVLPPIALIESFAGTAEMARARLYSRESRALATLRDTLLPRLISGELRVEDAERFKSGMA